MAIAKKKKTIDGIEYEVTQLGAKEGRALFVRISKMIGPSLASLAKADLASLMDSNVAQLAPAIETFVRDVSEEDLDVLCSKFAERSAYRDGKDWPELDRNFDDHFAGAYLRMIKWLAFCVEVNYADFFDAFKKARAGAEAKRAASRSESPTA